MCARVLTCMYACARACMRAYVCWSVTSGETMDRQGKYHLFEYPQGH